MCTVVSDGGPDARAWLTEQELAVLSEELRLPIFIFDSHGTGRQVPAAGVHDWLPGAPRVAMAYAANHFDGLLPALVRAAYALLHTASLVHQANAARLALYPPCRLRGLPCAVQLADPRIPQLPSSVPSRQVRGEGQHSGHSGRGQNRQRAKYKGRGLKGEGVFEGTQGHKDTRTGRQV
jgi:hypothetical protein